MEKTKNRIQKIVVQLIFVCGVVVIWEVVARAHLFGERSELVFPTLGAIVQAFVDNFTNGFAGMSFWIYILNSMKLLLQGLAIGIVLAFVFTGFATMNKARKDFVSNRTFEKLLDLW